MTEYNVEELLKEVDTKWLLYLDKAIDNEIKRRYDEQMEKQNGR